MSLEEAESLGSLVNGHPENVGAALPRLIELLQSPAVDVVEAAIFGLGQAWDARAAAAMVLFAVHESPEIRFAVARSLPGGVSVRDDVYGTVVAALVSLTSDDDADVRDWACFGLGQLDADGDSVRAALAARLSDPHVDTSCEALVALAKTGDPRALAETVKRLTGDPDQVWKLELEAASELGDPLLLPALERLGHEWARGAGDLSEDLAHARRRCATDAGLRAAEIESAFSSSLRQRLSDTSLAFSLSGAYPRTVVDVSTGDRTYMSRLWEGPFDPQTCDVEQLVGSWEVTARNMLE